MGQERLDISAEEQQRQDRVGRIIPGIYILSRLGMDTTVEYPTVAHLVESEVQSSDQIVEQTLQSGKHFGPMARSTRSNPDIQ